MDHLACYRNAKQSARMCARWAQDSQIMADDHPSYGVDQSEVDEWWALFRRSMADARYHRRMAAELGPRLSVRERLEASSQAGV